MIHILRRSAACLLIGICFMVHATPSTGQRAALILREGTPVSLAFGGPLSSKTAAVGDIVTLVLAQDIKVDGVIVAKAGSVALGKITYVKKAAFAGRSGSLSIRLDGLMTGDKKIKLRASWKKDGESEVQYSRPYNLKYPMGLYRTGDDVEIASGTSLIVFVAEDISLPIEH
ncbi:MAG: hypothetical protein ABR991_13720 [Terracidiphilus sp.]|jgi:hypothetical protein